MPRHALAWGIPLSLFVVLSGCPGESPKDGAVRVVIDYPDFTPGCVKVTATDEGGGESVSETLTRDALASKTSATIAVFRKPSWGTRLSLSVESYEVSCDGAVLERFSTPEPLSVSSTSGVQEWKVQLAAVDADRDGFAAAGTDCHDGRDDVHPGAAELCGAVDIDCDGATGCADTGCEGRPCDDQNACTTGDSCQGGTCAATPVTCTTPPGFCFVDVGACAQGQCQYAIVDAGTPCPLGTDGGLCANDGTCVPPSVEFDCSNGTDDDGDKKVDCADTDCGAKPCNDGNACTLSDACQGTTCTGTPMTCTPSSQCMSAGCVNGACQEQPAVDAGCSDGLGCTLDDRCDPTGACVGQTDCSAPPGTGCYQPTGTCTVQGCSYPVNKGAACNDSNLCTAADVCAPNGSCSGTTYACSTPPAQCLANGACLGDGGCSWQPTPGAACAVNTFAGACDADGGCFAPGAAFGYAPKNFAPGSVAPAGGVTLANCNLVFDSTSKTFVNGCGSAGLPAISEVTLSNSRNAVVLSMRSLVLESSASLTLLGDKPVIVAVYGNATVNGALSAYSRTNGTAVQGAGMNPPECATAGEGMPGAADTGGAGGGGGAGHGQGGAGGGSGGGGTGVPGAGGAQAASLNPEPLRGGCPGGDGANTGAGPGGNGGGAVQLSVAGTLTLNAPVSASGAGGTGASGNNSSGGGGGSGGTVVVEAASLVFGNNAALTANGGGGGGGAKSATANNGSDGTAATDAQAGGGNGEGGGSGGGKGGSGGSAQGAATVGVSAARGGGGGGGAVGFIYVRAANAGGCSGSPSVASPPPQYVNCP